MKSITFIMRETVNGHKHPQGNRFELEKPILL